MREVAPEREYQAVAMFHQCGLVLFKRDLSSGGFTEGFVRPPIICRAELQLGKSIAYFCSLKCAVLRQRGIGFRDLYFWWMGHQRAGRNDR